MTDLSTRQILDAMLRAVEETRRQFAAARADTDGRRKGRARRATRPPGKPAAGRTRAAKRGRAKAAT
jgi:hypothetical protein